MDHGVSNWGRGRGTYSEVMSCDYCDSAHVLSKRERERERERACAQPVHSPPPPRHACRGSPFMPLHPTSHKHAQEEAEDESKLYSFLVFFFREINREVYLSAISPKSKYSREWGEMVSNRKYGTGFTLHVGLLTRQIYTQKCVGLRIRYCTYLLILALSVTVNAGTVTL